MRRVLQGTLTALLGGLMAGAFAGTADYVHLPTVEAGEHELGIKYGTRNRPGAARETAAALGIGTGVTRWWASEVYLSYRRDGIAGTAIDGVEWENTFQFTHDNQHGIDVGFITELDHATDRDDGIGLTFGPLLQARVGPGQVNLNLLLSRAFDAADSEPMQLGYQFQATLPVRSDMALGVQAFGEMGQWNDWAPTRNQSHRIGPAIVGTIALGNGQRLHYDAAFLVDTAGSARGNIFRTAISVEF